MHLAALGKEAQGDPPFFLFSLAEQSDEECFHLDQH
jgi:hypothetical protein